MDRIVRGDRWLLLLLVAVGGPPAGPARSR
jgi:hypothetical protein